MSNQDQTIIQTIHPTNQPLIKRIDYKILYHLYYTEPNWDEFGLEWHGLNKKCEIYFCFSSSFSEQLDCFCCSDDDAAASTVSVWISVNIFLKSLSYVIDRYYYIYYDSYIYSIPYDMDISFSFCIFVHSFVVLLNQCIRFKPYIYRETKKKKLLLLLLLFVCRNNNQNCKCDNNVERSWRELQLDS